ncbi:MAG TPA: glycosyl transferase, partial [Treponema sp.]|nr:glycosyl transferase [Treponema sp.]
FQVLYQTFVSRSFGQTQKGYREIGFREIQDIFASMYYFHAQGNSQFIKQLLKEWVSQVYEFGYANHNFFWEGKEAGNWSDDALWLHQAVSRYVNLTGDHAFLDDKVSIAGSSSGKERKVFDTLIAILRYSTEISIGKHGLPLLDRADWNDCLRLDRNYDSGPEKEALYKKNGHYDSACTESVMNAFLAVTAAKELHALAVLKNDEKTVGWLSEITEAMTTAIHKHAWKNNGYARLLFNQYPGFSYAGAEGDGLDTDSSGGTFFLNSFSWAILSGVADDGQIASMLNLVRKKLKTPFGLKLVSPNDLSRVVPDAASAEYFPGDRENAAVFKHAAMMAVSAMLDAAKRVADVQLAEELAVEAWTMIDLVFPGRTMSNPFVLAGNPRFCTQYNNSETGENIGPLLSGTSTWFILSLLKAYGIELSGTGLIMDPILRPCERKTGLTLIMGNAELHIHYKKPEGFHRCKDSRLTLTVNGETIAGNVISLPLSAGKHEVSVEF